MLTVDRGPILDSTGGGDRLGGGGNRILIAPTQLCLKDSMCYARKKNNYALSSLTVTDKNWEIETADLNI
ncbi:hypothetical protein WA026_001419 [Henosepilachna vigintioctopunctata]|uniref:Uncharacterized protein n=1 Tax=Henosepilachna vigintioctopunctata TaxID=420089 RepID=A0AAW1UQB0_9CUCU